MIIYKTINKLNGKWYIGKDADNRPYYFGSGTILTHAIRKYGKENFQKIILEECQNLKQLSEREKHWIKITDALNDPLSYNLAPGGEGGDLSKFIDYAARKKVIDPFKQAREKYQSLTTNEKKNYINSKPKLGAKGGM